MSCRCCRVDGCPSPDLQPTADGCLPLPTPSCPPWTCSPVALPGELILRKLYSRIPGLGGTLRDVLVHCATHCDNRLKGTQWAGPQSALCIPLSLHGFHPPEKANLPIWTPSFSDEGQRETPVDWQIWFLFSRIP